MLRTLIAITVGVIGGISGQYYLFLGTYSLIPWGIAGLILGWFSLGKGQTALAGSIYGFAPSFACMVSGYTGGGPVMSRLPFFALLGLFGGSAGYWPR